MNPCCCDPCSFPATDRFKYHTDLRVKQFHLVLVRIDWAPDADGNPSPCVIDGGGAIPACPEGVNYRSWFACELTNELADRWEWTRITDVFQGKTQFSVTVVTDPPIDTGDTFLETCVIQRIELGAADAQIKIVDPAAGTGYRGSKNAALACCPLELFVTSIFLPWRKPWTAKSSAIVAPFNVADEESSSSRAVCSFGVTCECDQITGAYEVLERNWSFLSDTNSAFSMASFCDSIDGMDLTQSWQQTTAQDFTQAVSTLVGAISVGPDWSSSFGFGNQTLQFGQIVIIDQRADDFIAGTIVIGANDTRSPQASIYSAGINYKMRLVDVGTSTGSVPGPFTAWGASRKRASLQFVPGPGGTACSLEFANFDGIADVLVLTL